MNVIYKLTNTENGKSYIGQKAEVYLQDVDGVKSLVQCNSGEVYLGTSSNKEMQEALKNCVVFTAEVLEELSEEHRNSIYTSEREDYWIRQFDAVESDMFYNLRYPIIAKRERISPKEYLDLVRNTFGETYREVVKNAQAYGNRETRVKALGFDSITSFYEDILSKRNQGMNNADISRSYGKHRHFIQGIEGSNYANFQKSVDEKDFFCPTTQRQLIKDRAKGVSIYKLSEIYGLETDTIVRLLGTSARIANRSLNKKFLVAVRKGVTPEELGKRIMVRIVEGLEHKEVAEIEEIRPFEVTRYLYKFIREHIKINDLDGIKMG